MPLEIDHDQRGEGGVNGLLGHLKLLLGLLEGGDISGDGQHSFGGVFSIFGRDVGRYQKTALFSVGIEKQTFAVVGRTVIEGFHGMTRMGAGRWTAMQGDMTFLTNQVFSEHPFCNIVGPDDVQFPVYHVYGVADAFQYGFDGTLAVAQCLKGFFIAHDHQTQGEGKTYEYAGKRQGYGSLSFVFLADKGNIVENDAVHRQFLPIDAEALQGIVVEHIEIGRLRQGRQVARLFPVENAQSQSRRGLSLAFAAYHMPADNAVAD